MALSQYRHKSRQLVSANAHSLDSHRSLKKYRAAQQKRLKEHTTLTETWLIGSGPPKQWTLQHTTYHANAHSSNTDQKNKKAVAQEGVPSYSHHNELKCGRKQAALTLFTLALQKKKVGQWV
eukprot:1931748-Ditylum_brightwellii.AAC.1